MVVLDRRRSRLRWGARLHVVGNLFGLEINGLMGCTASLMLLSLTTSGEHPLIRRLVSLGDCR